MTDQTTLYFAGPLFTQGEWLWNTQVAAGLRHLGFTVLLPQETAAASMQSGEPLDAQAIFAANVRDIDRSDALVAVLDGADPDSGTCWECGYAFALGKPIIGVRTDFRAAGDDPDVPVNLMLSQSIAAFVPLPPDHMADVDWLVQQIATAIRKVTP